MLFHVLPRLLPFHAHCHELHQGYSSLRISEHLYFTGFIKKTQGQLLGQNEQQLLITSLEVRTTNGQL